MSKLTRYQEIILDCIKLYIKENIDSPTLAEIRDMSGLSSRSTVHKHVENLVKLGYLMKLPKTKRGIIVVEGKE